MVSIASHEVGTQEVAFSNCGPRVDEFKAATNLPPHEPWPWCAAFVDWVVWQAMRKTQVPETESFSRPKTASAWGLEDWSRKQDSSTKTIRNPGDNIQSGDIVIFRFSHVGIATGSPNSDGTFPTIEGNTNDGGDRDGGAVLARRRRTDQVKTVIRFMV